MYGRVCGEADELQVIATPGRCDFLCGQVQMKIGLAVALSCLLTCVACDRITRPAFQVIKMGTPYNMWWSCVGHASHQCGPEKEEIDQGFSAAFASEPECHGLQLRPLTEQERGTVIRDIDGYLEIMFLSPGQWSYSLNLNGRFLRATANNEREIARQVCRIAKGAGGNLDVGKQ